MKGFVVMGRPKKDARYLNVYIRRDIYDEFDEMCKVLGQSKTIAAERALSQYMRDNMRTGKMMIDKYEERGFAAK